MIPMTNIGHPFSFFLETSAVLIRLKPFLTSLRLLHQGQVLGPGVLPYVGYIRMSSPKSMDFRSFGLI